MEIKCLEGLGQKEMESGKKDWNIGRTQTSDKNKVAWHSNGKNKLKIYILIKKKFGEKKNKAFSPWEMHPRGIK